MRDVPHRPTRLIIMNNHVNNKSNSNYHPILKSFYLNYLPFLIYITNRIRWSCCSAKSPNHQIHSLNYRVFIKLCVFSKILKYIPDSGLSRVSLSSVYIGLHALTTKWQVEQHKRCSTTGRVQKNHNILGKKHNFQWTPCIFANKY